MDFFFSWACFRKRAKLRSGDVIEVMDFKIRVE